MSLNSLQDDMSRRAASMAAMAKRATNPQEIQAIQRSLINGVQSGAIQPHVGIPLIQDLTKKMTEVKAQMAQSMAGAGMQQPQQGGAPQQPIAQQIMAQAAQANQGGQGVATLPSNLPESYAGGGIIAFEEGGPVERYQNQGLVSPTPAGRFFSSLGQNFSETNEAAKLRNKLQMQYGPKSALPGLFMTQTDEERQMAKQVAQALPSMSMEQLRALEANGPSALANLAAPTQAVAPTATPAANINKDLGPVPGTTDKDVLGGRSNAAAPSALPGAPSAGIGAFKMPPMQTFTPTPAVLPDRKMDKLTDLNAITAGMPAKTKKATEDAVKETQTKLEDMDKPGFEARESRLGKREATQEKDSAMGRALNLMNLGFGIAGSKERTLAGALGNEGRQGIRDLIQGEAANRAARDKLEDYRDSLEQQKVAAKKGNYSAAQAAGKDAANELRSATALSLQGAQAGNAQSISMYSALQQGDIGKATVANQGQQLQLSAVSEQNRAAQAAAGLGLQAQQLAQTGAFQQATLAAQEKRYASMDKASQARIQQVQAKALNDFTMGEGAQLRSQLAKDYGPNFLTATDKRSLEAARMYNQRKQAYLADIRGQAIDALSARPAEGLLGLGE
jgi:hypothetical protein